MSLGVDTVCGRTGRCGPLVRINFSGLMFNLASILYVLVGKPGSDEFIVNGLPLSFHIYIVKKTVKFQLKRGIIQKGAHSFFAEKLG